MSRAGSTQYTRAEKKLLASAALDVEFTKRLLATLMATQWFIPALVDPRWLNHPIYDAFRDVFGSDIRVPILLLSGSSIAALMITKTHSLRSSMSLLFSAVIPTIMVVSLVTGPWGVWNSGVGTYVPLVALSVWGAVRSIIVCRVIDGD